MSVAQMIIKQMSANQMPADQMSADQMSVLLSEIIMALVFGRHNFWLIQRQSRTYWTPMQENSSLKLPQMSN